MNMSSNQHNTRSPKERTITITDTRVDSAAEIKQGDTVKVRPGEWSDGDLVAFQLGPDRVTAAYLYRSKGKHYACFMKCSQTTASRTMLSAMPKIYGVVIKEGLKDAPPPKKTLKSYTAAFTWPYFGVHYGDEITVKEDGQAKIGQLVLMQAEKGGPDDTYFSRLCLLSDSTVRVAGKNDKEAIDHPRRCLVGATVLIDHTDCNETKIEALRKRLLKLQNDITDSTAAYQVEREIYELEQQDQIDDDESNDEWPEVIG
jgi:hypothetical protein